MSAIAQRRIYWSAAIVCALSRFLALARSPWDWDEALFSLGMRSYDVARHHPHPPGFPVFIGLAHVMRAVMPSDFRALQSISVIAGIFVFPAVFMLARELEMRFETSLVAGALCAFFPNIWFFGGAAFSDVPSIVLVVYAVAFLFRGRRSAETYLIGSLLLALACGIRPQNFLIGLFPGVLATWYRWRISKRDVVFAALIGIVIVGVAFGGAVISTGSWEKFISAVRFHGDYIARVDSFRSPDRPPLWRLFDRFFLKQYDAPPLSPIVSIFVVISVIGAIRDRDRAMLYNALAFGPMAILAWLMLDRYSISRFSIGYIPMFALLAADGISRVANVGRASARPDSTQADVAGLKPGLRLELAIGGALVAGFFIWTLPALNEVRRDVAPTIAGASAIRTQLDPKRDQLFVAFNMTPFVELVAPEAKFIRVYDERGLPFGGDGVRRAWRLSEIYWTKPKGLLWHRERGHLWNIARRHYFDVALEPVDQLPQFTSGWYDTEITETDAYRWCGSRGVMQLPPQSGETMLRLELNVPHEILPEKPAISVTLNGSIVDRFAVTDDTNVREWRVVPAANNAPNTLELSIDRVYNAVQRHEGDDPRDLGMRLHFISFGAKSSE
jgi:hypothetical protein